MSGAGEVNQAGSTFVRGEDGIVSMNLVEREAQLLAQLADQITGVLRDASSVGVDQARKVDPAVARLIPEAYRGDHEASAEFLRFTGEDLLMRKVATAVDVRAELAGVAEGELIPDELPDQDVTIRLDERSGWLWLRFLTDARLTLAARLGINDERAEMMGAAPDPVGGGDGALMLSVYRWLGHLQESVVLGVEGKAD